MGFRLSTVFAFVALTLVESYAASPLPPQVMYWNSILPKASMPKSISELVKPDFVTLTRKGDSMSSEMLDIADENILHYPYNYVKDSPLYQKILEGGHGGQRVFFLEEDIHTGNTMKYRLAGDCTSATFLSRRTADEIPFSLSKLPDILNKFSVKPGSPQADMIKETIGVCEYPAAARGEVLQCATSLEAMIDFVTSNLGRNIEAISTEVEKAGAIIQEYTIIPGVKKLAGNELIACHKMNYPPYAVFLCHGFKNLRAYRVPMEGADGTKAKALAVCHEDTSDWSSKHYAMRELKIKPGTQPVCHFLKDSHVVWIQTRSLHDDFNCTSGRRGT